MPKKKRSRAATKSKESPLDDARWVSAVQQIIAARERLDAVARELAIASAEDSLRLIDTAAMYLGPMRMENAAAGALLQKCGRLIRGGTVASDGGRLLFFFALGVANALRGARWLPFTSDGDRVKHLRGRLAEHGEAFLEEDSEFLAELIGKAARAGDERKMVRAASLDLAMRALARDGVGEDWFRLPIAKGESRASVQKRLSKEIAKIPLSE